MEYFSLAVKDDYQAILSVLGDDVANFPGYWSNVKPIILRNGYAEYAIKQTFNGEVRTHLIGFSQDDNGQWLIEQL